MSTNYHDDISFSAALSSANVNLPLGQLDEAITDVLAGDVSFGQLNLGAFTSKTISSGAIVGNATNITVDTEASGATDDLDNITGGSAGDIIYIKIANASRTVVFRNNGGGTGNIRTSDGSNITFNSTAQIGIMVNNGSTWNLINNPAAGNAPTNATYITQTANATLTNEQALGSLATGIVKNTTTTGVLSIATYNVDYSLLQFAVLRDEKSTGTQGGASSAATWNNRNLNTEFVDLHNIVTISSNQFTPIAGFYRINVIANAFQAGTHRLRLYNVTAAGSVGQGLNAQCAVADSVATPATLDLFFTANGTDAFRIDHYTTSAKATNGLGLAVSDGTNEVYMELCLTKYI